MRGTEADGAVGHDLTHVGGRRTLGAGRVANGVPQLERWIARAYDMKPGVLMPAFHMLPPEDLRAVAEWLESLD